MLKLFLITRDGSGLDEYEGAVVAAKNEGEARLIHPDGSQFWNAEEQSWVHPGQYSDRPSRDWVKPSKVNVQYIGIADASIEAGVLFSEFHYG